MHSMRILTSVTAFRFGTCEYIHRDTGLSLTNNPLVHHVQDSAVRTPLASVLILSLHMLTLLPMLLLPLSWANAYVVHSAGTCVQYSKQADATLLSSVYTFFLAPFVHTDLLSGLIACFALYQLCTRLEQMCGTVALAHTYALLLMLTQTLHFIVVAIILNVSSDALLDLFARSLHMNVLATSASSYSLRALRTCPPTLSSQFRIPVWGVSPRQLQYESAYSWRSILSWSIPTQACYINPFAIIFALCVYECVKLNASPVGCKDTRAIRVSHSQIHTH